MTEDFSYTQLTRLKIVFKKGNFPSTAYCVNLKTDITSVLFLPPSGAKLFFLHRLNHSHFYVRMMSTFI